MVSRTDPVGSGMWNEIVFSDEFQLRLKIR